jgi:hypothetical protein
MAFLVALFFMLPQAFLTAEAFKNTLNPFDELDQLRREDPPESVPAYHPSLATPFAASLARSSVLSTFP